MKLQIVINKIFFNFFTIKIDTSGKERSHPHIIEAMKKADGVMIIFDLTKKESFLVLENFTSQIRK